MNDWFMCSQSVRLRLAIFVRYLMAMPQQIDCELCMMFCDEANAMSVNKLIAFHMPQMDRDIAQFILILPCIRRPKQTCVVRMAHCLKIAYQLSDGTINALVPEVVVFRWTNAAN
eukprot:scaffold56668_cov37-Prasinocladus_malaysianus.AAC.1